MKLLDKKQIDVSKAKDRELEIREGAKLAKKVDIPRETFSKEQTNLTQFRNETLQKVKDEITKVVSQKDEIIKDIAELEEKRKALLVPLNKEWEEVRKAKAHLEFENEILRENLTAIGQSETDLSERAQKLEVEESRISDMKVETFKLNVQAEQAKEEAIAILNRIKVSEQAVNLDIQNRLSTVAKREEEISYRELDLVNQLNGIKDKEDSIIRKEIQLRDREETLGREILRQQNG